MAHGRQEMEVSEGWKPPDPSLAYGLRAEWVILSPHHRGVPNTTGTPLFLKAFNRTM